MCDASQHLSSFGGDFEIRSAQNLSNLLFVISNSSGKHSDHPFGVARTLDSSGRTIFDRIRVGTVSKSQLDVQNRSQQNHLILFRVWSYQKSSTPLLLPIFWFSSWSMMIEKSISPRILAQTSEAIFILQASCSIRFQRVLCRERSGWSSLLDLLKVRFSGKID